MCILVYLAIRPLALGNADDGLLPAAVWGRCRETTSMSVFDDFTLKKFKKEADR